MGGANESSTSLDPRLCAQLSKSVLSPRSARPRRETCQKTRGMDAQQTFFSPQPARNQRWTPLRRGRRHHGGSAMEACLGAVPSADLSAAHTDASRVAVMALC